MQDHCDIRQAVFDVQSPDVFLQEVRSIAREAGIHIVCFNAEAMAGTAHVHAALDHARRAFSGGTPISNSFEMEALLYASGKRQCLEGARFGIHPGTNACFICFCPKHPQAAAKLEKTVTYNGEDWETIGEKKAGLLMELFAITPEELGTVGQDRLGELVTERVALLEVYR